MLQLMALGIPDVINFDFMSKPSPGKDAVWLTKPPPPINAKRSPFQSFCVYLEAVHSAVEHLELLGAVERKEGQVHLTALGKKMASFPLEPRYAKVKQFCVIQMNNTRNSRHIVCACSH